MVAIDDTPTTAPQPAPTAQHTLPENEKILLALPSYGSQVTLGYMKSLQSTLDRWPGLIARVEFLENDSLVCRARNTLVARFLRSDQDWMLFIDSDIHFEPGQVLRLWQHGQNGKKLVCGLYAMKCVTPRFVWNALPGEVPDANGMVKVSEAGTGFMLIHRSVFLAMIDAHPELAFKPDLMEPHCDDLVRHDFFSVGVYTMPCGTRRYLSEDWYFCQRARKLGFDVWMDTMIQTKHQGMAIFPLQPKDLFEAAEVAKKLMIVPDVAPPAPVVEKVS
jgi:hypothetical protein